MILGLEHPNVDTSLSSLAELYRAQGQYTKAEPLQQRALAIQEKALGPTRWHSEAERLGGEAQVRQDCRTIAGRSIPAMRLTVPPQAGHTSGAPQIPDGLLLPIASRAIRGLTVEERGCPVSIGDVGAYLGEKVHGSKTRRLVWSRGRTWSER